MVQYKLWRPEGEQFFDDNGDVLAGGWLLYYNEGTSTPLTVYKDDAGATNWGSSGVQLNAAGRLTDPIYVNETDFKEICKADNGGTPGTTVFEKDNYPGADAAPSDPDAARPLTPIEPSSSATRTMTLDDLGKIIDLDDVGGNITFVPLNPSGVTEGEWVIVRKASASATFTVAISNTYTEETLVLVRKYDCMILVSNGVDKWVMAQFSRPSHLINRIAAVLLDLGLADPNADRIQFWDDSLGDFEWLGLSGLTITGTTLTVDAASATAAGVQENADQAEMEAASSILRNVTPGTQHHHPGHPKFSGHATVAAGAPTLVTSYNLTSITDTAQGRLTVIIATDFSGTSWTCVGMAESATTELRSLQASATTQAAGSIELHVQNQTPSLQDPTAWHFSGIGDHA